MGTQHSGMGLIDLLNPWKTAWWRRDEWVPIDSKGIAVEVMEENGCPSWDIRFIGYRKYKNKHTCEERVQNRGEWVRAYRQTVFEDPTDGVELMGEERPHVSQLDFYEGGKYE